MMQLFIHNITSLDCALLLPTKGPVGNSWELDVYWEGIQNSEGMLIDFSDAKKIVKNIIDSEFDHKLFITASQIYNENDTQIIAAQQFIEDNKIQIFAINTFKNSLKIIDGKILTALEMQSFTFLEKEIAQEILKNSPKNINSVTVTLRNSHFYMQKNYYSYLHMLCNHTGNCQRFHGHSSLFEAYVNKMFDKTQSDNLALLLNNKYIVIKNCLSKDWSEELIAQIVKFYPLSKNLQTQLYACTQYASQGNTGLIISKEKTLLLDYESTIENIVRYAASFCKKTEILELKAYEGLYKGAIYKYTL